MKAPDDVGAVFHMVCPRLLELDKRHADHAAYHVHPLTVHFEDPENPDSSPVLPHSKDCGCLIDRGGHKAATVILAAGDEIADDHPDLVCRCGLQLTLGQRLL